VPVTSPKEKLRKVESNTKKIHFIFITHALSFAACCRRDARISHMQQGYCLLRAPEFLFRVLEFLFRTPEYLFHAPDFNSHALLLILTNHYVFLSSLPSL